MNNNYESTPICPGHNLPARLWWTKKQPPRQFYRCSKPIGEQCNFFEWVSPEENTLSQPNMLPPTPNSSMPFSQTLPESPSTPTPASRNVSAMNQDSPRDNIFHSDVDLGSSISRIPTTPAKPASSIHSIYGSLKPMGLAGSQVSQFNDTDASVPNHGNNSRSDDVPDLSFEVVSDMIRQLRALPTYLKKLEKQKSDADSSGRAYNTAIISLQEQVDKLEAEVTRRLLKQSLVPWPLMKKCPIHDLALQTRHMAKPPFRRFHQCPESENNSCNYTDWIDPEPTGSQPQAASSSQSTPFEPLSQEANAPSTPIGSQTKSWDQWYQNVDAPSTPTPKRTFSTISSREEKLASSQKRLKIIQETLASPSPNESVMTTTSSQNSKFGPPIAVANIKYDNPAPGGAACGLSSDPVASDSNEDPFQDTSTVPGRDAVARSSNGLSTTQMTPEIGQEESSDVAMNAVSGMIRRLETLPEHIRNFEARKTAAEKSRDAKNTKLVHLQQRIKYLEDEVRRLTEREKQLEEVIEAYEQQS
ncbi:hypothetical protein JR316_0002023 [Psilocybe cubensis]|uniref:Uncharacterized protein n=2 Tax=Psilocybe cubensis TaxID=181762 RepID=A0ACB8HB91_PSICU|nr:hypothetical protein JR316_0002023 [Psilocybe cubensis]KAH9485116.1 hypothetical protein JR316_0002023 [Psilocybe cubensis]